MKMLYCIVALSVSVTASTMSTSANADSSVIKYWQDNGVTFTQPTFVIIDKDVQLASNVTIGCGAHLLGASTIAESSSVGHYSIIENCTIGAGCMIDHYVVLKNCTIGNNVHIFSHSVLENSTIESGAQIGPFARTSEHVTIKEGAVIGNFVQVKRSTIGKGTKAQHLSYLGDATLGERVNIGAGTITCNYNGVSKNKTEIHDNALIGSNNCLVAPVTIGKNAMTGAGSTITQNVPDNCLAIARTHEQVNKEGYAPQLLEKYKQEKAHKTE